MSGDRRLGAAMLTMVGLVLAVGIGSVLASRALADQSVRRSEQKLCGLVVLSDDAYRDNPPTTELGRRQAINFAQLRRDLGCPR